MQPYLRLRQICLAAPHLEASSALIRALLGVEECHRNGSNADVGVRSHWQVLTRTASSVIPSFRPKRSSLQRAPDRISMAEQASRSRSERMAEPRPAPGALPGACDLRGRHSPSGSSEREASSCGCHPSFTIVQRQHQ
jgi:hypothetical protein